MGGPKKEDKNLQRDTAKSQINIGNEMAGLARDEFERRKQLQSPLVELLKKITGGDRDTPTQAIAPMAGEITRAAAASKEAAYDVPAGAGRDYAMATIDANKNAQIAGATNQTWMDAFSKLAGLGTESGQMGLQSYGGAFRGFEGGSQGIGSVMQVDAMGRASLFNFLGSLAEAGGTMAGAGIMKSDRRLKRNIRKLRPVLNALLQIEPVTFDYIDGPQNQIGVIAQDVQPLFPEVVIEGADGMLSVNYTALAVIALQAVQELQQEVLWLRSRVSEVGNA